MRIAQAKSGIFCSVRPGARMLKMVTMKLMAPRMEEMPATCSAKMARSTAISSCEITESGG